MKGMRSRFFLWLLGCAACGPRPAADPVREPAKMAPVEVPAEVESSAPSRPAPEPTLAEVWRRALSGDVESAHRALDALLARTDEGRPAAQRSTPQFEPGLGFAPVLLTEDAQRAVLRVEGGVLVANALTGQPLRFFPSSVNDMRLVPGTNSFVAMENDRFTVADLDTGKPQAELETRAWVIGTGRGRVAYLSEGDGVTTVSIWDRDRPGTPHTIPADADQPPTFLDFLAGGKLLAATSIGAGSLWDVDAGKKLASWGGAFTPAPITTADGKLVVVANEDYDAPKQSGVSVLEWASGKILAHSSACPSPSAIALSPDEKQLVVGDVRKACVLGMPKLGRVFVTKEVRPSWGPDDDLQGIANIHFVDGGRSLGLETQDGALAFFVAPRPNAIWKGRGQPVDQGNSRVIVVDRNEAKLTELVGLREIRSRALTEAEVSGTAAIVEAGPPGPAEAAKRALDAKVCSVRGFVVPRALCSL